MSFHTRLAQIGRNKPRKQGDADASSDKIAATRATANFYSDPIPF
jgi:hypothetical protein